MLSRTLVNQSALGADLADEIINSEALLTAQATLQESGGTLTTDASEQLLYVRNAPMSTFEPRVLMLSLDDMVALDDLTVKVYYRVTAAGGFLLYDTANYVGADGGLAGGRKMIAIELLPNRFGVEVTVQMSVGTADLPWTVVEAV